MFKSSRVGCYLNGFGGHGDDSESKELKLVLQITPITLELANEISPLLADRLFRNVMGEWLAAGEITKASFSSIPIPMQNITFNELPEGGSGVVVPGCAISNLRAARAYEGAFRLEFDVVVPMDGMTMRLVEQFYKATCFLTMEPIQRELIEEQDGGAADTTQSLQEAADAGDEQPKKRGRRKKAEAEPEPAAVGDGKSAAAGE